MISKFQLREVTLKNKLRLDILDPFKMHWNVVGLGEYSDPAWDQNFLTHLTCEKINEYQYPEEILILDWEWMKESSITVNSLIL